MEAFKQTPLSEIRRKEQEKALKDQQLAGLGLSLAQEKIKNAQKDASIAALGKEIAGLKIEIMQMKGGAS